MGISAFIGAKLGRKPTPAPKRLRSADDLEPPAPPRDLVEALDRGLSKALAKHEKLIADLMKEAGVPDLTSSGLL